MGEEVQDLQLVQMLVAASSEIEVDPNFWETKFVAMKSMPFVSENACDRAMRKDSAAATSFEWLSQKRNRSTRFEAKDATTGISNRFETQCPTSNGCSWKRGGGKE